MRKVKGFIRESRDESRESKKKGHKNYLMNKSRTPTNERSVPRAARSETRSSNATRTIGIRRMATSAIQIAKVA